MSKIAVFLGVLACAGLLEVAFAHGGHLHDGDPLARGYPTVVIKSSTKITVLRNAKKKYGFKTDIAGSLRVLSYLYGNCTDKLSSAVSLDLTMTSGVPAIPVVGAELTGGVFTGSCAQLKRSSNMMVEINNSTTPASKYIWFDKAATNVTGRILGYGANDGMPKGASFKSVVLFEIDSSNRTLVESPESLAYYLNYHAMFCASLGSATPGWQTALDGKGVVC